MRNRTSCRFGERAADLATILAAGFAIAVAVSFLLDRREHRVFQGLTLPDDREVSSWQGLTHSGRRMGPGSAPIVIVEFGDYECPYCRRAEKVLRALRMEYPDEVAVVFRHFPLGRHPTAYLAARYAECAADQGQFVLMHQLLFKAISLEDLDPQLFGKTAGVPDLPEFSGCVTDTTPHPRIERDMEEARSLGVRSVPAFIVNGTLFGSPPDSASLFGMVRSRLQAMDEARPPDEIGSWGPDGR